MLLVCSGFFQLSFGQEKVDCSEFKRGTFYYTPPNGGEVKMKRTKKKQIEKYNDENQKFIFRITWINDCEYELELINAKGLPKERKNSILGIKLSCLVVESSLGHYEVVIKPDNNEEEQRLTIYTN